MSSRRSLATGLVVCLGTAATILSSQAFAGAATGATGPIREEILVTGSRIARADLEAVSPIVVVQSETLEKLNIVNAEEFLRQLPQFAAGIGGNTNNGNDGSSTVDLRNLGEERTLVLVNGKRFVPFDYQGYVDVAMIPARLIERVEIITGGASAVYGSEAIAGVVNFILKNEFEGAAVDGSYFVTEEGDGDRYDLNATIGGAIDGGKGHIVFNVGYVKQNQITQAERPYGVTALDDLLDEVGSFTTPNGTVFDTGFPGDPEDGLVQFDAMGNAVPFANTFNFNPFNLYLAPQQKWTATTLARYELSDKVEMFGRLSFANNKVDTVIAPTGTFFESVPLNYADNPYLGPTARARFQQVDNAECDSKILDADDNWIGCNTPAATAGDGIVDNLLGRRLVEIGTRDSFYENTAYQVVGGLTGDIFDEQKWEVFGQWGRTNRTQSFANDTSLSAAQAASIAILDPDPNSATFGEPICAEAVFDPNTNTNNFVPSSDANCAPANFYGGMLSDAAGNFLRLNLNEINKTSQMVIGANLTGDTPWTIPSAESPLAYAVGIEYREEKGVAQPDNNYATGNAIGFGASSPVDARIEIVDYFLEAQLPLLQGVTGAQQLMVDFGIRYGDYSNKVGAIENDFDNTSWKIGGEWAPIDSLRFRTSYQEAVRAPTLQEIGLPLTPSTGDLTTDPCSQEGAPQSAELVALCEATGVPGGNTGTFPGLIAGQINNFLGGNPTLEPEDAETLTAGLVWTPNFFDSFTLTLDYYSIDITNVIVEISEQNTVNACYEIEQDPNSPFCQRVLRNITNGALYGPKAFGVNIQRVNAAFRQQQGIDFTFNIGQEIGPGRLDIGWNSTYVLEDKRQDADFLPEFDCVGLVGNTCLRPGPEFVFFQTTNWTQGPFNVQLIWQYIDQVTQDAIVLDGAPASDYAVPTVDEQHYFNLAGSWAVSDNWTLRLGIDNLFDNDPPITGNDYGGTAENSGNTFPATYSPLGRSYFFAVNSRW